MIVVCGEALIDFVPRDCGGESGYVPRAGGSHLNVAIGLARLGVPVGFLGRLSTDWFGRFMWRRLEADGVDMRFTREGHELSTFAIVNLPPGQEPEYAFHGQGTADAMLAVAELPSAFPDEVAALHFGSISLMREPAASTYEACMRRERGRHLLTLDPNVRPGLIPDRDAYIARLEGWVGLVDLVKVSRADLAWLYPDRSTDEAATAWMAMGPRMITVTMGTDGATAYMPGGRSSAPGVVVPVVDTVGAGDAFTSGLLAWLDDGGFLSRAALGSLDPEAARDGLAQANLAAALACTRSGAEPPTRAELLDRLGA